MNQKEKMFSLRIKKDSDFLNVDDRYFASNKKEVVDKTLRIIKQSYLKAPYFNIVFPILKKIFNYNEDNLFLFLFNSIDIIKKYLEINTEIVISSSLPINHKKLKGKEKVMALVHSIEGKEYINSAGGKKMYSKDEFKKNNIDLKFIESKAIEYKQFDNDFVPWLSIIDIMMFNSVLDIKSFLIHYKLS
jgi:hypothetical protein